MSILLVSIFILDFLLYSTYYSYLYEFENFYEFMIFLGCGNLDGICDCSKKPYSVSGKKWDKGCYGAVTSEGMPSHEVCINTYQWYKECCKWDNGSGLCRPKN